MRHLLLVALAVVSCSPTGEAAPQTATRTDPATTSTTSTTVASTTTTEPQAFQVSTPSFEDGGSMPRDYTCDGADVSPRLVITGIPTSTQSLALIVNDPDAPLGTWDHWVEFNIPAGADSLELSRDSEPIGVQGVNSWNLPGYMGPCPREGEEHHYVFTVYALDTTLDLPSRVESSPVYSAMEGHVIERRDLTGTYGR